MILFDFQEYAFEQLKDSYSGRFKEELDNLSGLEIEAQLESLKSYFNLNLYDFFVKMMHQYIFNGGDILNISQMLIFDSRRLESTLDDFKIVAKRKLIEFATLWGITIIILVVVQLSLSMFYDTILEMSFYSGAIFGFFVVFLVFLYLILLQRFNLSFINENMPMVELVRKALNGESVQEENFSSYLLNQEIVYGQD